MKIHSIQDDFKDLPASKMLRLEQKRRNRERYRRRMDRMEPKLGAHMPRHLQAHCSHSPELQLRGLVNGEMVQECCGCERKIFPAERWATEFLKGWLQHAGGQSIHPNRRILIKNRHGKYLGDKLQFTAFGGLI